jgi:dipeptidyl aminopeptidase/acylaminoacyl peptidase
LINVRSTRSLLLLTLFLATGLSATASAFAQKPPLTLDDFFNSVSFDSVRLAPDGHAVVMGVQRADWEQNIFRRDLYLYRDAAQGEGTLRQLTQSGHDGDPEWSPDGRWIAFLSERKGLAGKSKGAGKDDESDGKDKETTQLFLISPDGGEAFPVTTGEESIHAFAWSADSKALFYSTRIPWTKAQKDTYKKDWKDVVEYRKAERGDQIFALNLVDALAARETKGTQPPPEDNAEPDVTPGARAIARSDLKIAEISASPNGKRLAFLTTSVSEREEIFAEFEIYGLEIEGASLDRVPKRLTNNEAQEARIGWAEDNQHVFFHVGLGSVEGKYKDSQERVYWVDADSGATARWAADFDGSVAGYALQSARSTLFPGALGTQVGLYRQASPAAKFEKLQGWPGSYGRVSTTKTSSRVAFVYSSLQRPEEIYIADGPEQLQNARPITSFNKLLAGRELPQGKSYRWKSTDGTPVEGLLIYPPGKFEAKGLPMLTLIHGGPADADSDHFEADWYQWSALAATNGWLVLQPNYRGSTAYGDKFLMQIVPEIVSRPGKDILAGVDALVSDGIADPEHLAIAGYSYGGYMTNWLITQTTRFKAAMTGAGAVEHAANWGNDDMTFDDAYFLGGRPWEAKQRYHDEAALFQIDKVKTPTHMVGGSDDIRVAALEDYLLDHALHALNVPSTLLIFPGEGHSLGKNPWHGKIKVREELKWLEKYAGKPGVTK